MGGESREVDGSWDDGGVASGMVVKRTPVETRTKEDSSATKDPIRAMQGSTLR